MGTLTKIGKPIKFEISCQNEAEAERIHDEIATAMKEHGWGAPIQIWTDMPNSDPSEIFYYVRVGDWNYAFSN
jgi:hypothetical protein